MSQEIQIPYEDSGIEPEFYGFKPTLVSDSYIEESEIPKTTEHAEAELMHSLCNPSTTNMVYTNASTGVRYMVVAPIAKAFEARGVELVGKPNNFLKPLYPQFTFYRDVINGFDRRSPGRMGTARELNGIILANRFSLGNPRMKLEHLREPYRIQEPAEKKDHDRDKKNNKER